MLPATESERQRVVDYVAAAAEGERVEFLQKAYSEVVQGTRHDVWDVHTRQARWWVITNPANLYSQQEFPDLDLALTFHVGLCLRIPGEDRAELRELPPDPLLAVARELGQLHEALQRAETVPDFQAIAARCRACLLSLIHAMQDAAGPDSPSALARSDFRGWASFFADSLLEDPSQQGRRALLKASAASAWEFASWLAHAHRSHFHDAEAALAAVELAVSLFATAFIRRLRSVPMACPACGSQRLALEWARDPDAADALHEWPLCEACGWTGPASAVAAQPRTHDPVLVPEEECSRGSPARRGRRPVKPSGLD